MTVEGCLKTAASNLRQAASVRKAEMDMLRKQIQQHDTDRRRHKDELKREEQVHQMQIGDRSDNQAKDRAVLVRELASMKSEETDTDRQFEAHKTQLNRAISDAEQDMNDLLQKASELEQRSTQSFT